MAGLEQAWFNTIQDHLSKVIYSSKDNPLKQAVAIKASELLWKAWGYALAGKNYAGS